MLVMMAFVRNYVSSGDADEISNTCSVEILREKFMDLEKNFSVEHRRDLLNAM